MDNSYALNSPEGSPEDVWRHGGSPTSGGHRDLELSNVPGAGSGAESPLCGTDAAMSGLAFPPLEFDSLPSALSLSCPPSYRDYPLFKAEKSPHDIADALLSLKHAVVHPQFGGPLSPLSPPPMPHLGHGHCPPGQGLSPYPALPSPGPHGAQGISGPYGSAHGQSMLHNAYSVGVEVGVGSQLPHQYAHQYPESCPSPAVQVPPSHPPPPSHHPAQASMPFPAMSVNVSMSMNVGVPPNLGGATYNCGPPHPQQWPPPPLQAPPPSPPPPLGSQYHHHHHHHHQVPTGNLHSNWLQSASGQYPGYSPSQLSGGQTHPHVMPSYTSASYTFGSDFRSPMATEARSFYYHKPASAACTGAVDSFKDSTRYCPMRHPHPHLHGHNHGAATVGLNKRSKFLSDKVAMAAAAAAAVSVSGGGASAAGMMMGVGVGEGGTVGHHAHGHHHHHHHHHHQGLLKTNLCRICGKTYARPSTLKTHLRTHSGEKPYKCSTCSKSFSQAANLTAHIRTHSGEKPFRCPVCDRRFSQSSSVTTHMRTHSGDRPYRCRLCKKAFSDSSTLTKHLRIHSGEKPYQCKLCLLRFSQSGNLNRHMRVHANQT